MSQSRRNRPHVRKFKFQANLRWLLSNLEGGEDTCVDVLRQVREDDPDFDTIQRVLEHWDGQDGGTTRSLDLACDELKIQSAMLYGWFARMSYELGYNMMRVQLAAAAPVIMQAAIDKALDADGHLDRKMLMDAIGILPKKRGIAIQQNTFVPAPTDEAPAAFEDGQRDVAARLREGAGTMKQIATTSVKVER